MDETEVRVGTVLRLTEDELACLEVFRDRQKVAAFAFETATRAIMEAKEETFCFLRKIHPELDAFEFAINYKAGNIRVVSDRLE